jgi:hypothetical protein
MYSERMLSYFAKKLVCAIVQKIKSLSEGKFSIAFKIQKKYDTIQRRL